MTIIKQIILIAQEAGTIAMKYYDDPNNLLKLKSDDSPLTKADLAANDHICSSLRKLFPNDGILTEEEQDNLERLNKKRVWIIDPIDGTKEFINKNGEFTVNIGLVEQGKPVLGVVYAPAIDKLYYAIDKQAFLIHKGETKPIKVSNRSQMQEMIITISRSHAKAPLQQFCHDAGFAQKISAGSSLKGCLIAEGVADVTVRDFPFNEWDMCAMQAVVEAAGGVMTDLRGEAIRYNEKKPLKKHCIISNNAQHEQLVKLASALLKESNV